MADQTRVDVTTVTSSADAIGALLPPGSAHERLGPGWASPGSFEAAGWLDRVVRERADGVAGYAGTLRTELTELREALSAAARDLATTDTVGGEHVTALRGRGAGEDG